MNPIDTRMTQGYGDQMLSAWAQLESFSLQPQNRLPLIAGVSLKTFFSIYQFMKFSVIVVEKSLLLEEVLAESQLAMKLLPSFQDHGLVRMQK